MKTPRQSAIEAYRRGDQLHQQGRDEEALKELLDAVELDPSCPNAGNFAGWLLAIRLVRGVEGRPRGIDLLEQAVDRFEDNLRPLANLAEACVAAGEPQRAVIRLEAELARDPWAYRVGNLLGWLLAVGTTLDPERGIAVLREAVKRGGWYGDGLLNLGRALARQGDLTGALAAVRDSLVSGDVWDPGLAELCAGELFERMGMPGRALSAFRRSAAAGGGDEARRAALAGSIVRPEGVLRSAGRFFPHPADEAVLEALGRKDPLPVGSAPRLLKKARRALEAGVGHGPLIPEQRAPIEAMVRCAGAGRLPGELAGVSFAAPGCPAVERLWWPLFREMWLQDLDAAEPDPLAEKPVKDVLDQLVAFTADGRNDDARVLIRGLISDGDEHALLSAGDFAQREGIRAALAGRRDEAQLWFHAAEDVLRAHASWSTSGGEGMARMAVLARFERRRDDALADLVED